MSDFRFELTDEEKSYLRELVEQSIAFGLNPSDGPFGPPEPPTEKLREHLGAFVTLKLGGSLRGCIGNVQGSGELFRTIWDMAQSAAFHDPRFPPLTEGEFHAVEYEISILSPLSTCPDPKQVEVGRHGLIMSRGGRSGLLLPQVPVEWCWDRETFLSPDLRKGRAAERRMEGTGNHLLWFEAVVF